MHYDCAENSKKDSGCNLERSVSDEFFEHHFRKIFFGKFFKGINKDVEEFCMFAGLKANTHCIMANDYSKDSAYCKFKRTKTKGKGADCCKGRNGCGMSARHAAIAEKS